ncbi:hypothetical protein HO173_006689 [Letharia columbiana]|uniref:Uncharacterized protein n=1 Tax=Letharia columbiana TaxID=112416 RepID=A0A8H6FUQ3_9LECA|nr:uncharacterized protein HO173_006689 [Letharia columbiana]KAF6235062.1 hypothetical protein HO173_006689 [Letharia columbiana]
MSSSASSNSTETVTNIVFGVTATTISIVTVWQGHRVWKMWHEYVHDQEDVAPDIELGIQSSQSTPRSLEAPERDEVIASSAPSADQVGGVAESVAMPGSVQHPELQPTLPMTVDAEASLSSALVQGTPIDSNGLAGVDTENAQPALTDVECQELRPAANDHL